MKLISRFLYLAAAGTALLASCAKEEGESYDKFEDQALEAWMTQHRPELLNNYQPKGGYYVDVIEPGHADAAPVNDTICWVKFDLSGRDLSGNIILTRSAREAVQAGTFTRYTHYVPFYSYCGEYNSGLMEGTYLAMRDTLYLDKGYAQDKGVDPQFVLREGSKVVLYLPSRIVGSGGVSPDGGYEGQYTLSAGKPFVVTMEIRDTVKNPLQAEGSQVDAFCESNGKLKIFSKSKDEEKSGDTGEAIPTDPKDPEHPYNREERWVSACDTVAQVYVNYRFDPKTDRMSFPDRYDVGFAPYNDADLEKKISDALVKRFHPDTDDPYKGVAALEADSVKLDGTAEIWYIGRFLDGFIFDTNIDEVKEIIYGEVRETGSSESYKPEEGGLITAFYYTVPNLKYGQWASFITTSTNGYGTTGKSGSTGSSGYTNSYYDYLNYMYYMQGYYGNSGYYGGYYGDYYGYGGGYGGYGDYYGGYYGDYGYNYGSTDSSESTPKVYTEVPAFTPLIFEFYIEPKE